ncbi:cytochrome P450 [Mycena rebaudengoi]|nr:cytochrome P450 [Mycena rebaudengoi]
MDFPSISTALLAALCICWLISSVISRARSALASPLSRVPGPWYAAVSDIWLMTHMLRFKQTETIHKLFQKYGPIGPQKVVFCDLDALRSVYLTHRFEKAPVYKQLKIGDVDQSLTLLDNASHTARRKAIGSHYTAANVAKIQPAIRKSALEFSLHAIGGAVPIDCLDLLRSVMVDILVHSSFGYTLGAVQKWTLNKPDRLSIAITDFPKMGFLMGLCPTWVWKAICQIPRERVMWFTQSMSYLRHFVTARVDEAQDQISGGDEFGTLPFIHRLLEYRTSTNEGLTRETVIAEAVSHLIGGSETSSTTLTYCLWELSRHSDIVARLQTEIDAVMPNPAIIPDVTELQALPYLTAFIQEGHRLHNSVPILLERAVPDTGSFELMGYLLPPGTVVATQSWSMHKDPAVFPSPERFNPERWLDDNEPAKSLRAAHMMPFGLGTRACVGQQLAQASLRIILAVIVRNFTIRAHPTTTAASMTMKQGFTGFPDAGECKLILIPRTKWAE